ncbi:hypothetical protein SISSUDRAFT_1020677 [Sistotremastrum suecicum HHB10207 ss-3]|uniref:Uncharacterized protein n=1 Tax=Sistotremastrum suecicum HHB10207 ss-3 TaxID=1314776 RepID=A0A166E2F2_9AGAM|nr:hypothetical protein SISSUDRAFT_1020677 [Sistotremastrum suecicum HHB10207 ss-3]
MNFYSFNDYFHLSAIVGFCILTVAGFFLAVRLLSYRPRSPYPPGPRQYPLVGNASKSLRFNRG